MNPVMKVKVIKVIKDFGLSKKSLIIPLSYKIRLNQVRPANKIHPYNHFSEYFLYFCSIGAWMGMKVWHHKTMHKKFKLKNEAYE